MRGRYRGWVCAALRAVTLFACAGAVLAGGAEAAPTTFTEYPVEIGHQSSVESLTVGSDGKLWFADGYWPEGAYHALIGRFDPSDGSTVEFDQGLGHFSVIRDFVAGPDGNMWFADSGSAGTDAAIGKVTPAGQITEYASTTGGKPWWIIDGGDGALWFTSTRGVGRVTTAGEPLAYELPGVPGELAVGADGNVWFTYGEGANARIGRVEEHPGESTVITLFASGLDPHSAPERIVAAGGYLWFTDRSAAEPAIGRVSSTGQITEFRTGLAAGSQPADIAVGPDGNVWFTDTGIGAIGKVIPDGQITEFTDEDIRPFTEYRNEVGFTQHHLVAGPEGNMWFTIRGGGGELGKATPAGHITIFRDGENGLSESATVQEITAGPRGELWFDADHWDPDTSTSSVTIGRIAPGDDNTPAAAGETGTRGGAPLPSPPGPPPRITLPGGRILKEDGHGKLHLRITCQSTTPCAGQVQLTFPRSKKVVTSAAFALAAGGSMRLNFWLPRRARQLLATKGRRSARLSLFGLNGTTMSPVNVSVRGRQRAD